MANVSVLGCGGWGIALAVLMNNNGHNVTLWSALDSEVDMLLTTRINSKSLPGIVVPEEIKVTSDLVDAVTDKEVIVMAVASAYVRSTANKLKELVGEGQIIVDVAKGIEDSTLYTMTEVIKDELPQVNAVVLSGPSHAEEVGKGLPTTCVVGANNREIAVKVQNIFMSDCFRVYTNPDVKGIELGGSLKNVIALAAGIADGLGYGDNTKAALITRGIHEIARLGVAMGCNIATFTGLTGIGDLIVTCASMHSRNRRAGILIGKGSSLDEAVKEVQMVVEGVFSAKAALALGKKYNVSLPIIEKVNQVLFDNMSARDAVVELMIRDKIDEITNQEWSE